MQENYKGYSIKLEQDEIQIDPRKDFYHVATMVCFHRRYYLPNESEYQSSSFNTWIELKEQIESDHPGCFILPIFMYDHSGVTIKTAPFSCPWDSGQIGFIYISKEKARFEFGRLTKKNIEKVFSLLESEVKEYDQYLTGDVWSYSIDGIDSCSGFYGYDYALQSAHDAVDSHLDFIAKNYGIQEELALCK